MGRVYASADWHGCWSPVRKLIEYLKPDDTLYFLGDAIDRGSQGADILDFLITRPNTYYIKGNHEYMMSLCLPYIIKDMEEIGCIEPEKYPDQTWFDNSGWKTIEGGLLDRPIEKLYEYKKFIDNLPLELKYRSSKGHTIIMEHAGYTPFDIPHRSHDPLWDREHFYDRWASGSGVSEMVRDTYLVHGHTPVQYLKFFYGYNGEQPLTKEEIKQKIEWKDPNKITFNWKPTIIRYCNGHKINIDMCTIVSNRIALLDLDTFEVIYFDKEN